ncbi:MAG: RNA polymerase sigma factor [Clostridia bacterium]|nr:RNA polymerase sigma factor [Clostridia bacterium]
MDNGESSYRRYLTGDESAFEEILELYKDNLIFFLCRYVESVAIAEEIAADCFALLITKPDKYDFSVSLKTWLFTVGRNRALDYLRRKNRWRIHPLEEAVALPGSQEDDPEALFLKKERERQLHRSMGRLKPDYRAALHLVYFEELSYEEAGRVLQKSKKQIENLVYRGKNALRTDLEKEGFEF